jgi:hypothetical protein
MFCVKCGRDLPEGAAYCPNCGVPAKPEEPGGTAAGSGIDEIGLFVGKNAGYYKTIFRKFNIHGVETFAPTWNWSAFLCNFFWMLYRKLYLWALLWFVLTLIPISGSPRESQEITCITSTPPRRSAKRNRCSPPIESRRY